MGLNKNKIVYIVIILVLLFSCNLKIKIQTKGTCINYLKDMSYSWKLDSIGSQGARSLIYVRITERCGLVGMKWKDIEEYFGTPNIEGSLVSKYNLRFYSKIDSNYRYPVLEYISISLDNDKNRVVEFKKEYIDPW